MLYPDEFYSFKNGVKVNYKRINEWLKNIIKDLINAKVGEISFKASGDTFVIGIKMQNEYEFIVANSEGYSELTLDNIEFNLLYKQIKN